MTRPLVVRFGALGDMVLMTVPIRILSERYGCPVDVLGSGPWTRPLLEGQPGVGQIYLIGSRKTPYWLARDQHRLVRQLRERGAGPTWLFDAYNDKTRWLLERAGWQEQHLALQEKAGDIAGEHFCERWRRVALMDPPLGAPPQHPGPMPPALPELRLSPEARAQADRWLERLQLADRPLILIQVGNKRTMRRGNRHRPSNTKYWPESHWAALLRELRSLHPEHALLMLGVAAEARCNDEILQLANVTGAYNLAREMTVPRLLALAGRAEAMISVDTGPAHVAAALGCPVVTLFDSVAKARMYAPRGRGQADLPVVVSSTGQASLLGISVGQVMAAWRDMNQQAAHHRGDLTGADLSSGAVER